MVIALDRHLVGPRVPPELDGRALAVHLARKIGHLNGGLDAGTFEQARRCQVLRHLQRAPDRQRAGRAAVVVVRRPVVGVACITVDAADRRIGDRRVFDQRVGLQTLAQRGEIAQRLDGGAGLAHRLGGAVELAQGIGEAAGHGELWHRSRAVAGGGALV